jgi:formate dehydrogenase maturation protein FdhE
MWGINKEKNLSLLRSFRDREIASNRLGQEYLRLLYSNSTEIATLLLHNPRLGKEVRKVINELLPDLRSLLSGKKVSVSKKKVTHLESLLKKFEKRGSPQLKAAVKKVRKDLRKGVLFKQFGITIDERRVGG